MHRYLNAQERQLIVDVGANVGHFAVSISKAGLDSYNFEPGPETCAQLKRNVATAGLIFRQFFCAALGVRNGTARFQLAGRGESLLTLLSLKISSAMDGVQGSVVPIVRLDDVVPQDRRIALLKTDTLGVLRGAHAILTKKRPALLIIEMSYGLLREAGSSPVELMQLVQSYGYVCTHFAFHGVVRRLSPDSVEYGLLPVPPSICGKPAIAFTEMENALRSIGPLGKPGWTDLLCW
jgi:FkbM family methyltransferase